MFKITKDLITEPGDGLPSRVGTMGEQTPYLPFITEPEPLPSSGLDLITFRLYDDDGELYYEGELHDDEDCMNQSSAQLWGEKDAGCTTIKVLRDGEWVQEIG
jgi:hypothetical protein